MSYLYPLHLHELTLAVRPSMQAIWAGFAPGSSQPMGRALLPAGTQSVMRRSAAMLGKSFSQNLPRAARKRFSDATPPLLPNNLSLHWVFWVITLWGMQEFPGVDVFVRAACLPIRCAAI